MAERWQSGLMRTLGERESGKPDREFESRPLRHGWEGAGILERESEVFPVCLRGAEVQTAIQSIPEGRILSLPF